MLFMHVKNHEAVRMVTKLRKLRTHWLDDLKQVLLEICIKEKRTRNRSEGHLNGKGWETNVKTTFKERITTSKPFDKPISKVRWYTLKGEGYGSTRQWGY